MNKSAYQTYLTSREWAVLREAVKERAGGMCERCCRNPIDAVHHLTYERKGNELLSDLQGICNPCHEFTHAKSWRDPCYYYYLLMPVGMDDLEALRPAQNIAAGCESLHKIAQKSEVLLAAWILDEIVGSTDARAPFALGGLRAGMQITGLDGNNDLAYHDFYFAKMVCYPEGNYYGIYIVSENDLGEGWSVET